jgi:hypothetical protein
MSMSGHGRFLLVGAILGAAASPAAAGSFTPLDSSARGASLGGMMAALAADADANLWNPAGLLWLPEREITAGYADLFGLGLVDQTTVQFGWPLAEKGATIEDGVITEYRLPPPARRAIGLYFTSVGASSLTSSYDETQIGATYAWRTFSEVRAGASVRLLRASTGLEEVSASGTAVDLGIQRNFGAFRLGVVIHDLISRIDWKTGTDDPLPQRWNAGLAWLPHPTLRATVETSWASEGPGAWTGGAAEWQPVPLLALRGGARTHADIEESTTEVSAGAGLAWNGLGIDYAFLVSGHELGTTHRWSASLEL